MKVPDAMKLDPGKAKEIIVAFLSERLANSRKTGIALGLSGGMDSSLVAVISKDVASSPRLVHCLHMPDFHTHPGVTKRAADLARTHGFQFFKKDITEIARREGAFRSPILKCLSISSKANRLLVGVTQKVLWALLGKTAYQLTLEAREETYGKQGFFHKIAWQVEESFNIRHRIRKRLLERHAHENNLLGIGCANKSEFFVGWFVKDGIDDLPIEPLLGLYKTQIRTMADHLGLFFNTSRIEPSPDMIKGLSDELCIGLTYDKIDLVAAAMERRLDENSLTKSGISLREILCIKRIHELTDWKRMGLHEFPSV